MGWVVGRMNGLAGSSGQVGMAWHGMRVSTVRVTSDIDWVRRRQDHQITGSCTHTSTAAAERQSVAKREKNARV